MPQRDIHIHPSLSAAHNRFFHNYFSFIFFNSRTTVNVTVAEFRFNKNSRDIQLQNDTEIFLAFIFITEVIYFSCLLALFPLYTTCRKMKKKKKLTYFINCCNVPVDPILASS